MNQPNSSIAWRNPEDAPYRRHLRDIACQIDAVTGGLLIGDIAAVENGWERAQYALYVETHCYGHRTRAISVDCNLRDNSATLHGIGGFERNVHGDDEYLAALSEFCETRDFQCLLRNLYAGAREPKLLAK